jgi:hypothetical protein
VAVFPVALLNTPDLVAIISVQLKALPLSLYLQFKYPNIGNYHGMTKTFLQDLRFS